MAIHEITHKGDPDYVNCQELYCPHCEHEWLAEGYWDSAAEESWIVLDDEFDAICPECGEPADGYDYLKESEYEHHI